MTNERFNKKEIDLKKVIPSDHFRTVESFVMHKVYSEIKVELELKDSFMQKLTFKVPWDGKMYAYLRHSSGFLKLCYDNEIATDDIKTIYIQDWDDNFSIIFELKDSKKEVSFFVSSKDIKELLENCCRIPEQK